MLLMHPGQQAQQQHRLEQAVAEHRLRQKTRITARHAQVGDRPDCRRGQLDAQGRSQRGRQRGRHVEPMQQDRLDRQPGEDRSTERQGAPIWPPEGRRRCRRDETARDGRQVKNRRRSALVPPALPKYPCSPDREDQRVDSSDHEQGLRGEARVRQHRTRYQQGGDAHEADEATLHGVARLAERGGTRRHPLGRVKQHERSPHRRGHAHQCLAHDRRYTPRRMRLTPRGPQTGDAEHDSEE